MKHALVALTALVALALPGMAVAATKTSKPVHPLGPVKPFVRQGTRPGQGFVVRGLHAKSHGARRTARGGIGAVGLGGGPNAPDDQLTYGNVDQVPPASIKSLPRVMHGAKIFTIYWVPPGYRQADNYQSTVNGFFQDVASASNNLDFSNENYSAGNPYSTDFQYGDSAGTAGYSVSWGGTATDTHAYPAGQCSLSSAADLGGYVPGANVCLSDSQVQAEVKRFADSQGWPHGPSVEFFVYTAHNVASCFYATGQIPSGQTQACSYTDYCAYHSEFGNSTSTEYIYANMPWPNQQINLSFEYDGVSHVLNSDCDGGEHPNGTGSETYGTDNDGPTDADAADEVINVSSHENNEAITDPTGYGWWVDNVDVNGGDGDAYSGYENGDLCAWVWTNDSIAGQADNGSLFTNTIEGDSYFIQGEWSNADANSGDWSGCDWQYSIAPQPLSDLTMTKSTASTLLAGSTKLTAKRGTQWLNFPSKYWYYWYRCADYGISKPHFQIVGGKPTTAGSCSLIKVDGGMNGTTAATDTYSTVAADARYDIDVYIEGYNGHSYGGNDTDTYDNFGAVPNGEPENTSAPAISSNTESIVPGSKLTLNVGSWSPAATSYNVTWERCFSTCSAFQTATKLTLAKANASSYTVQTSDANARFFAIVTAVNAHGTSEGVFTDDTDAVSGSPALDGDGPSFDETSTFSVGGTVTVDLGSWSGSPTGYAVTVYRCTDPDNQASCEAAQSTNEDSETTSVDYTVVPADAGQALLASVVATNAQGSSITEWTEPSDTVDGLPVNTAAPTLSAGPYTVGDTIDVTDLGTWTNSPTQYRYYWYTCADDTSTADCYRNGAAGRWNSGDDLPSYETADADADPDFGGGFVRIFVQALNDNGFGNAGAFSDAVEVDPVS